MELYYRSAFLHVLEAVVLGPAVVLELVDLGVVLHQVAQETSFAGAAVTRFPLPHRNPFAGRADVSLPFLRNRDSKGSSTCNVRQQRTPYR